MKGVTGPRVETPAEQEARAAAKQLRLVNLRRLFEYSTTDTLISVVSDTAREAGLELAALTVEEVTIESLGTLQYDVRHISVIIEGPTDNVQVFLGALYDRVPVVAASNARIVDLDSDPSTQLQLEFYLSPEPKSDVSEETAG